MSSESSPMGRVRVALVGQFGTGNLGNDASLEAALTELRAGDREAELLCLCFDPQAVTKRFGLRAEPIRHLVTRHRTRLARALDHLRTRTADTIRIYRLLRPFDAALVPGSGYFEGAATPPEALPSRLLSVAIAARMARTRLVIVSVGAEPADRRSTRALLGWTLRLATYRSFRDGHSRRSAVGFGAPCEADPIYPDVVFGLAAPTKVQATEFRSVGVGVIDYRGPMSYEEAKRRDAKADAYIDTIVSFTTWLLDNEHNVTLLTGDHKDEEVADTVRDRVLSRRPSAPITVGRADSFHDLLDHMRHVDCIVASRYHNIVAAVMTGTPAISLGYRAKNGELLDDLGMSRFHQLLEHIDESRLRAQFADLERSADEVSRVLASGYATRQHAVAQQWSALQPVITRAVAGSAADRDQSKAK